MAKNSVQVVEINEGKKIEWKQNGYQLSFRDEDLAIRCDTRQRDYPIQIDISLDDNGNLITGVGNYYVAQILIPAIKYEYVEVEDDDEERESKQNTMNGDDKTERVALPLDMSDVVLTLWAVGNIA